MIPLNTKPNTTSPTVTEPFGNIKDNTGINDGTPVNKLVYADFHQFFEKMFLQGGLTANGLPDNVTNGFQLFQSLMQNIDKYNRVKFVVSSQALTNADLGSTIYLLTPVNIVLPPSTGLDVNKSITIVNANATGSTISAPAGNTIQPTGTTTLNTPNESITYNLVVSNAYYIVGRSNPRLPYINQTVIPSFTNSALSTTEMITGATFTTPNDGITRNYEMKLTGTFDWGASAVTSFMVVSLYKSGIVIKTIQAQMTASSGTYNLITPVTIEFVCISVAPNTTLDFRLLSQSAAVGSFTNGLMIIKEFFK